jgi:hypothetical protein
LQGVIEAGADFVGFAIVFQNRSASFLRFGGCGLKFFNALPIIPISHKCNQIPYGASGSSFASRGWLRQVVTAGSSP